MPVSDYPQCLSVTGTTPSTSSLKGLILSRNLGKTNKNVNVVLCRIVSHNYLRYSLPGIQFSGRIFGDFTVTGLPQVI